MEDPPLGFLPGQANDGVDFLFLGERRHAVHTREDEIPAGRDEVEGCQHHPEPLAQIQALRTEHGCQRTEDSSSGHQHVTSRGLILRTDGRLRHTGWNPVGCCHATNLDFESRCPGLTHP
ncbi:hypothetical protein GCM10009712_17210 [Pseudarthrobacter sulfonivorans]